MNGEIYREAVPRSQLLRESIHLHLDMNFGDIIAYLSFQLLQMAIYQKEPALIDDFLEARSKADTETLVKMYLKFGLDPLAVALEIKRILEETTAKEWEEMEDEFAWKQWLYSEITPDDKVTISWVDSGKEKKEAE